ncbi:MAG: hypothetical protein ABIG71_03695 [Candidatus Uhrbacteria bacterium]
MFATLVIGVTLIICGIVGITFVIYMIRNRCPKGGVHRDDVIAHDQDASCDYTTYCCSKCGRERIIHRDALR